jgi:hypothetical protein
MRRLIGSIALVSLFGFGSLINAQEVKINTNFAVEADGTIRMDGNASTWDDIIVPLTLSRQGASSKPDFDVTNVGLTFIEDPTEIVYIIVQMPHSYKIGTTIYPHIHWQQTASNLPAWTLQYKWFNNGETIPATFTTITLDPDPDKADVFVYTSGNMAQISAFTPISGAAGIGSGGLSNQLKDISSMLLIKLYRNNTDSAPATVLGFQFDIHYEKDTQGSREAFVK